MPPLDAAEATPGCRRHFDAPPMFSACRLDFAFHSIAMPPPEAKFYIC